MALAPLDATDLIRCSPCLQVVIGASIGCRFAGVKPAQLLSVSRTAVGSTAIQLGLAVAAAALTAQASGARARSSPNWPARQQQQLRAEACVFAVHETQGCRSRSCSSPSPREVRASSITSKRL